MGSITAPIPTQVPWLPSGLIAKGLLSSAQAETLRLLTWGGYAPENVIEMFEAGSTPRNKPTTPVARRIDTS